MMRNEFVTSNFYIECDQAGYSMLAEMKKGMTEQGKYTNYDIWYNPENMTAYIAFPEEMDSEWEDDFEAFAKEVTKLELFIEGFCVSDWEACLSRGELEDGRLIWFDITQFLSVPVKRLQQIYIEENLDYDEESDSYLV